MAKTANKSRTKKPLWQGFFLGGLTAAGVYLGGLLLLALLLTRGALSEGAALPATAVLCAAGAFSGGWLAIRRTALRSGGVLLGAGMAAVLAGLALCLWEEAAWLGHGGVLLLCALAGGMLASFLHAPRRRRSRK